MEYLQFLILLIFSPLLNGIIKKLKAQYAGTHRSGDIPALL